jgi:hypothetical protein
MDGPVDSEDASRIEACDANEVKSISMYQGSIDCCGWPRHAEALAAASRMTAVAQAFSGSSGRIAGSTPSAWAIRATAARGSASYCTELRRTPSSARMAGVPVEAKHPLKQGRLRGSMSASARNWPPQFPGSGLTLTWCA